MTTLDRDLTRWSRAGLNRFQYINGNAAEYLETLRSELADRFPHWVNVQSVGGTGAGDEQDVDIDPENRESDRLSRVLAQYHDKRRDWAWEIGRAFSRACHILTQYIDAYANENYIGTASQWDNLRKLVEMLGYSPAPPASASTRLVLTVKQDKRGLLKKGFQVKHKPPQGGPAVIFETLEDAAVDAALNELRLKNHDRSPSIISGNSLWLKGPMEDLNLGDPVILEKETQDGTPGFSQARIITGTALKEDRTLIQLSQAISAKHGFVYGRTWVHLKPKEKLGLYGPTMSGVRKASLKLEDSDLHMLRLADTPYALNAGDIVYISDTDQAYYRRVEKIKDRRIYVNAAVGPLDLQKAYVSRARHVPVVSLAARDPKIDDKDIFIVKVSGDLSYLQHTRVADVQTIVTIESGKVVRQKEIPDFIVRDASYTQPGEKGGGYTRLKLLDSQHKLENPQAIVVKPVAREWRLGTYLKNDVQFPFETTLETQPPKKTSSGDFAVVVSGNQYAWGHVANVSIDKETNRADLTVDHWYHRGGGRYYVSETVLFGHFKINARLAGWDENHTPVADFRLPVDDLLPALIIGKPLILEKWHDGGRVDSMEIRINEIHPNHIFIDKDLTAKGYTRHNTVIRGNVVLAGHGESKPTKVLGSGRATKANQMFTLKVGNVAFIADATQSNGVRADIDVKVGDRTWEQVSDLNNSTPTQPHYVARMTEDGFINIGFGDGINGRRVPSGNNNVRVTYRVGTGLGGNVQAGSLVKPVKPHPLIDALDQPLDASGGNDMEDKASLRQTAPATLLTLERAVSLKDFANLVAGHSSVWQARAFKQPVCHGYLEVVDIIVVPADGTVLGELADTLTDYVQAHAAPHVKVRMRQFERVWVDLSIHVTINTQAFEREKVIQSIEHGLKSTFSLKKRLIGQALYLGEVYSVVESVTGVVQSICTIAVGGYTGRVAPKAVKGRSGNVSLIRPDKGQVAILDPLRSKVVIQ
ncbi:MAG: baseplate J/gp47 family protein [Desulfobacteraceae bacterium]|jgi:hypothetical protein